MSFFLVIEASEGEDVSIECTSEEDALSLKQVPDAMGVPSFIVNTGVCDVPEGG